MLELRYGKLNDTFIPEWATKYYPLMTKVDEEVTPTPIETILFMARVYKIISPTSMSLFYIDPWKQEIAMPTVHKRINSVYNERDFVKFNLTNTEPRKISNVQRCPDPTWAGSCKVPH
jgi:hypothetical protein